MISYDNCCAPGRILCITSAWYTLQVFHMFTSAVISPAWTVSRGVVPFCCLNGLLLDILHRRCSSFQCSKAVQQYPNTASSTCSSMVQVRCTTPYHNYCCSFHLMFINTSYDTAAVTRIQHACPVCITLLYTANCRRMQQQDHVFPSIRLRHYWCLAIFVFSMFVS